MERAGQDTEQLQQPRDQMGDFPPGWRLGARHDGPTGTTVRFIRNGETRRWVVATGDTYAEAVDAARRRMALYDEIERD